MRRTSVSSLANRGSKGRRSRSSCQPQVEALERRELLATYTTLEDTPLIVNDPVLAGAVIVTPPAHGKISLSATGGFGYAPAPNYNGDDSFVYRVGANAPNTLTEPATISISITPVNDPPEAHGDQFLVQQGTPLSIAAPGLLKNDSDVEGDSLTAIGMSQPAHGTVTVSGDGSFVYTPTGDYKGPDSFTYVASDGKAQSKPATVSLYVAPINTAPEAHNDSYSMAQDSALTVKAPGVLGNDVGVNGRPLTASVEKGPQNGTLTLNGDGSFTYTPNAKFFGLDTFTYRATDVSPAANPLPPTSSVATVTIYVQPTSPIVYAANDVFSTTQNASLTIADPGVLKNDYAYMIGANGTAATDPTTNAPVNIPLTASLVSGPANGTLTLSPTGGFVYVPNTGFFGADTFVYKASVAPTTPPAPGGTTATAANTGDPSLVVHDTATVTIYVKPLNTPPEAHDDLYLTLENQLLTVALPGVLANDKGPTGDKLGASLVTNVQNGKLTLNGDGSFTYTPNANFFGVDSFTYAAIDTSVPPTTANSTADSTGNGNTLPNPPTPHPANVATVTILVQPTQLPVFAANDEYKTAQATTLTIAAPGVLGNDQILFPPTPLATTDSATGGNTPLPPTPGYTLSATAVTQPAHGTLTLNGDGSFTYVPDPTFAGDDTFTYQATATLKGGGTTPPANTAATTDPNQPSGIATVTIHVKAPELPGPVAKDDFFLTAENTKLSISVPGVLKNDFIRPAASPQTNTTNPLPPTLPLTAVLVAGPSNGTVTLNVDGSFDYTAKADFVGTDTFTYQASEAPPAGTTGPTLLSNIATVTIRVVAAIAHNDTYSATQDATLTVTAPGVLGNDAGGSAAHPLMATLLTGPAHGTLTLNGDGSFVYTPKPGYSGPDIFAYRASDGTTTPDPIGSPPTTANAAGISGSNAGGNVGIVQIYVKPTVTQVEAHDDKYPMPENAVLTIKAPGVLANDVAPANTQLSATLVAQPKNGTLTLNGDGSFTYTPNANFIGEDKFTYSVAPPATNAAAGTPPAGTVATVTIYVLPTDPPPPVVIGPGQKTTDESGPQQLPGFALPTSTRPDGTPDTFTVTTDKPQLFAAPPTIDPTGQLVFTPAPNASGQATVTVTVDDGDPTSPNATQSFTIEVDKPHPYYNTAEPCDVTSDGTVSPLDALTVINYLNAAGNTSGSGEGEGPTTGAYYDVNGDGSISPVDALAVINELNAATNTANSSAAANDAALMSLVAQDTADTTQGKRRT